MNLKNRLIQLPLVWKIVTVVLVIGLGYIAASKTVLKKTEKPTYQTAVAEKGTLVTTIAASGTITSGNTMPVNTSATGVVTGVYVQNGDTVSTGQKMADIQLDQDGLQRQSSAYAAYLSAQNQVASAKSKLNSLQVTLFQTNQKFINDAVVRSLPPEDPTWIEENAAWLAAEADYKNQSGIISQSEVALSNAWYTYQLSSAVITAPTGGTVANLTIAPGLVITSSSSGSGGSNTSSAVSQKIAAVQKDTQAYQATVTLSEMDAAKVVPGQKVTLTMDAFPDKTFSGRVLVVNTNGSVSSGVSTYPTTLVFDAGLPTMYPNMAVDAKIITNIKDNVLLVPTSAVVTTNSQPSVRTLQNGQLQVVPVETGGTNDTQTEIVSGITEGQTVVTSVTNSGTSRTQTSSPFSAFGGRGFGGGAVRVGR